MTAELILGTAQLGSAYGINNKEGILSQEAAFQVLNAAYGSGIRILDTAERYGNSEDLIGAYIDASGKVFRICTKLSDLSGVSSVQMFDVASERLGRSLERLAVKSVFIYYLHDFAMCEETDLLGSLRSLKSKGLVENIGVSIYEPYELRIIIEEFSEALDIVQIPFNVFNCSRWVEDGLLERAVASGLRLAARSVYVQGLIFMDPKDPFIENLGLGSAIGSLQSMASEVGMEMDQFACSFVQSIPSISWIILGSETVEQTMHNAGFFTNAHIWSQDEIEAQIAIADEILPEKVDPRKW